VFPTLNHSVQLPPRGEAIIAIMLFSHYFNDQNYFQISLESTLHQIECESGWPTPAGVFLE
jgi:hypothetical protein